MSDKNRLAGIKQLQANMVKHMAIRIAWMALTLFDLAFAGPVVQRTATPTDCPHPTTFMAQTINHNSNSNSTFQQKYQIIDDYYKPGGFIFYQHGTAAPYSCLEGGILPTWAEEIGALLVSSIPSLFRPKSPRQQLELGHQIPKDDDCECFRRLPCLD